MYRLVNFAMAASKILHSIYPQVSVVPHANKTCNQLGASMSWASASRSHFPTKFAYSFTQCSKFFAAFAKFGSVSNFSGYSNSFKEAAILTKL